MRFDMETLALADANNLHISKSSKEKKKIRASSIPNEIIFFDILSRLPVKSLLQFRCVSKLWCSFIRNPSFATEHLSRSIRDRPHGFRLLISAIDRRSSELHFLSAGDHGGPSDHLFKLSDPPSHRSLSEHVNGLFLIHHNGFTLVNSPIYICNPSTREFAPLPFASPILFSPSVQNHVCCNLGFDSSKNEHKVLSIRVNKFRSSNRKASTECRIFSLRTYSWRKIDPVIPFDVTGSDWLYGSKNGVCVNSAIHWILWNQKSIVAFDMKEEKFHMIPLPHASVRKIGLRRPYMIQINGSLAIVCCQNVEAQSLMEMWVLKDYENEVWVMEGIILPSCLVGSDSYYPRGTIYTDEMVLKPQRIRRDCLCIPFYDMKKGSYRIVEIGLPPELASGGDDFEVTCTSDYMESILSVGDQFDQ